MISNSNLQSYSQGPRNEFYLGLAIVNTDSGRDSQSSKILWDKFRILVRGLCLIFYAIYNAYIM